MYNSLPWQQNLFFFYEVSVLLLLIPPPEVINLCLGHQNPSVQQLVLILKMLQVKRKSQWKKYNYCWQTFSPRYKKREMDLFSLSCLFVRTKCIQEISPHPRAVTRDTYHHYSILQYKSCSAEHRRSKTTAKQT